MRTMTGSCAGIAESGVEAAVLGAGTAEPRVGRLVARNIPPAMAARRTNTAATRSQRAFGAAWLVARCRSWGEESLPAEGARGRLCGADAGTSGARATPRAK